MRRFGSLAALFALVAAVALAGCGDSGDSEADAQPYVDALATSVSDLEFSDEDANCLAGHWVKTVKVDSFEKAGITPDDIAKGADAGGPFVELDLDEGQANGLFDAFEACDIDPRSAMTDEGDMSAEVADCLDEVLSGDRFRKFMVASLTLTEEQMESDPELAEIFDGLMACSFLGMADDGWDMDMDMDAEDWDADFDMDMDDIELEFDFDFDEDA